MPRAVESLTCISREMTARLTREKVLETLEGDYCELSLEEDSDFNEDGIYGYVAEVDNAPINVMPHYPPYGAWAGVRWGFVLLSMPQGWGV